jgi:hypothetical protein
VHPAKEPVRSCNQRSEHADAGDPRALSGPFGEGKNSKKLVFLGNSLLNPASGGQEKIVHDP